MRCVCAVQAVRCRQQIPDALSHRDLRAFIVCSFRQFNAVSQVARQRGSNASQLFAWRRHALAKGVAEEQATEDDWKRAGFRNRSVGAWRDGD
jgi:hypothetical protein